MKKGISGLLLAFLLAACGNRQDLVSYVRDERHGLRKEITLNSVVYKIQYKPVAYILGTEQLSGEEYAARKKQLEGTVWFNIDISIKDFPQSPLRYKVSGLEEYNRRLDYYLNAAAGDVYLLYGRDTLQAESYWFENNQNLAAYETMVVGFRLPDGKAVGQDLRLSFYDRAFKNGILKAVFKEKDIRDIPGTDMNTTQKQ